MKSGSDLQAQVQTAADILAKDGVVGMPTETVYGLAARLDRLLGLEKIFHVKNRPFFDPLIVHVDGVDMAKSLVVTWSDLAQALADKFWPGPLTMILPKNEKVPDLVTSGLRGVGLRCPRHLVALQLITQCGPLAAPSANRFGRTSPTTWQHVEAEFGNEVYLLKADASEVGIESTVVRIDGCELSILRPGIITGNEIAQTLVAAGIEFQWQDSVVKTEAPGQMKHHYLPAVPLVWVDRNITPTEICSQLKLRQAELPTNVEGVPVPWARKADSLKFEKGEELALPAEPEIAARVLYSSLRSAAETGADFVYFRFLPSMQGQRWEAVLERLTKATSIKLS